MDEPLRVMPNSEEAEISVLGAVLLVENAIDDLTGITVDHFYQRPHQIIYETIQQMHSERLPIDTVTVTTRLKDLGKLDECGGAHGLSRLTNLAVTSAHLGYYSNVLREKARLRGIIQTATKAIEQSFGNDESHGILDVAQNEMINLSVDSQVGSKTQEAVASVLENIMRRKAGENIIGLPTDIPTWDTVLNGMMPARFYVLAARPGNGKTSMMEQAITRQLLDGHAVLVFEKDMDPSMLISRMACRLCDVIYEQYEKGKCSQGELVAVERATLRLASTKLFVYSPPVLTASDLRAIVRKEQRLHDVKSVWLDHILNIDIGNRELREGLTLASAAIRNSVQDTKLPHVIVAQLNREADKSGRPHAGQIKEFDALFADCDAMIMLWREKRAEGYDKPILPVKITIVKNRYGPISEEEVGFDLQRMKYVKLEDENANR